MVTYTEKQFGWPIISVSVSAALFTTFVYLCQWGQNPVSLFQYLIILPAFFLVFLFFGMHTTVDSSQITIRYGIGWIKKVITLDDISSVNCMKNKWYEGAGIKCLYGGILYSINFTDAVELKFKNTRRFIRIGSKTPEKLKQAILDSQTIKK